MGIETADVLVVGAGIAGLACAAELVSGGARVIVLERSAGVGGRCATRRVEGQPVDHGMVFLHGADAGFLRALREVDGHTIVGQSIISGSPFEKGMMGKDGLDPTSVEGAKDLPYSIPNVLVDLHTPKVGVPVLWWRSVGHSHTGFVVESFIDELAHAAGKDPFEFRRRLLVNKPRHRVALELAAKKAGWGRKLPKGRARGIAVHDSFGSFISQVAEVSVGTDNMIRVHRVVCVVDCGRVVNPSPIRLRREPSDNCLPPGRRGARWRQHQEAQEAASRLPGRQQRECVPRRVSTVGGGGRAGCICASQAWRPMTSGRREEHRYGSTRHSARRTPKVEDAPRPL